MKHVKYRLSRWNSVLTQRSAIETPRCSNHVGPRISHFLDSLFASSSIFFLASSGFWTYKMIALA